MQLGISLCKRDFEDKFAMEKKGFNAPLESPQPGLGLITAK